MQPLTAPATVPAKDLDDVLGRFHAWAKTHKAAHKTWEPIDGVREVSYEEALQSSRRRWHSHTAAPSASAGNQQSISHAPIEDHAFEPDTVTLGNSPKPFINAPVQSEPPPGPFGTVLSETVSSDVSSGPLTLVWPAAGKVERQVSMSLRVAASEQALIKARAAEAGLSVSAYLRQCALEVEKLRAQVHHSLALMEQKQSSAHLLNAGLTSAPPSAGGFFARLRQRIFRATAQLTFRA